MTELRFEDWFLEEYPRLVTTLAAWSGNRPVAEDLAQEAMIAATRDWERVRHLERPGAWVRRVALNRAKNEHRRRGRERRAIERLGRRPDRGTAPIPGVPQDDEDLWRAVRSLPDRQRTAIILHYVDDLPLADIAEVLGCSVGSVKTHLQRGRQRLAGSGRTASDADSEVSP